MAGYEPLNVKGNETGLITNREEFILPDDAYPILENAYVWRERIKRKQGFELLGRLRRTFTNSSLGNSSASPWNILNIYSTVVPPITVTSAAEIEPGSVVITIAAGPNIVFTDQGNGTLTSPTIGNSGTINYITGDVVLTHTAGAGIATTITFNYFPSLPVMGLRSREITSTNNEQMVAFDQTYAYVYISGGFQEFLPGTTWTGSDSDFFWSTNYWVGTGNLKIFWVTNDVDPIRYTNGQAATNWVNFTPVINAAGDFLLKALCMLPFRGRMVAFNTDETDGIHPNRIRWAQIGNPFDVVSPIVSVASVDAWRDDIRGKGGFLDIPTNEDIITVGFVRDNLVIYCERSTWQLRYTGRSIAPFQIEKVNSELGVESTFSGVQFDTSLVGIGDKGIVECDSYQSQRIDIKIVDLVINDINNLNNGTKRVHGIRDFEQKLAYWIYPDTKTNGTYPDRRLVYNYENQSWAIFTDSLTCLGTFQFSQSRKWNDQPTFQWQQANFPWINRPALFPSIMGGNQQGFVLYLDNMTTNQESLFIQGITGNTTTPTSIKSPNHNLQTGDIISITSIPTGTHFDSLNGHVFMINRTGANDFTIQAYSPFTGEYNSGQFNTPGSYPGGGLIRVRDNFRIVSKKFNYMDQGKQFQLGYIDVLFDKTDNGAITLKIYNDYNDGDFYIDGTPSNLPPQNETGDTFFNSIVETSAIVGGVSGGKKNWRRVFCPTNANFVTIEWTLNNEQMQNQCQESDVQIDAQVIWRRVGGRLGITQ